VTWSRLGCGHNTYFARIDCEPLRTESGPRQSVRIESIYWRAISRSGQQRCLGRHGFLPARSKMPGLIQLRMIREEHPMSVLGSIIGKSFGRKSEEPATGTTKTASSTPSSTPSQAAPGTGEPIAMVDVEAVLTDLSAKSSQRLDWRHSIVDLMKLLDMDSSLAARKELAQELHYSGDTNDSASMNVWLHKQVMVKLAENGGRVPEELKA
jgi:hypothetical protein